MATADLEVFFLCFWVGPSGCFSDSKFYLMLVCMSYFIPGK